MMYERNQENHEMGNNGGLTVLNLNELKAGEYGIIRSVGGEGALRQHFLDIEEQMMSFMRKSLCRYISDDKIFAWNESE